MRHIREKLHSRGGASMLLALLFFFFCLTVGAVVLTAASANAGRLARQREEQQRYLAVESAALLLREDFADLKLVGSYAHHDITHTVLEKSTDPVTGESYSWTWTWSSQRYSGGEMTLTGSELTNTQELITALRSLYRSTCMKVDDPNANAFTEDVTVTPMHYTIKLEPVGLPAVVGTLTMATDPMAADPANPKGNRYAITATLSTEDGAYPMTLYFRPVDQGVAVKTETLHIPEDAASNDYSTSTKRTTYTQTIQWQTAEISKGGEAP